MDSFTANLPEKDHSISFCDDYRDGDSSCCRMETITFFEDLIKAEFAKREE